MWMFTKDGFFSVVEHRGDDTKLIVRARDREDLETITELFPVETDLKVLHTPDADYEWRLVIDRRDWAKYCKVSAWEIDYDNFKNAIKRQDPERAHLYMNVWAAMRELQQ